jgi:hypothetical protein
MSTTNRDSAFGIPTAKGQKFWGSNLGGEKLPSTVQVGSEDHPDSYTIGT